MTTDVEQLKSAATGRWPDILSAVGSVDASILDGRHHPCPICGGRDRFRLIDRDAGAVLCNQCFGERNGDGIAAVRWLLGCDFKTATGKIAEYLGVKSNGRQLGNGQTDIVAEVATRKRIPLESFKAFGAHEAKRGKLTVCRVPMYGPDGKQCSHFDLSTRDDRWLKGYSAKGKPAGLFLKGGKLPEAGQAVCITEGVKDAAALDAEGFNTIGIPRSDMAAKFARCFRGCRVVVVPDRDAAGERGAQKTAARLAGVASVRVATLPADLKAKHGDGVREVLAGKDGRELLRQAIGDAIAWQPESDGRPQIELTPDEHVVNAAAAKALTADETTYQRAGELVRIIRGEWPNDGIDRPEDAARIAPLPPALLRDRLTATAVFVEAGRNGLDRVNPPQWCVKAVHARGYWPGIRPLAGIVETPVLRADGSVLATRGYDKQTGLLFQPAGDIPSIPPNPTFSDATGAAGTISQVVAEFPFAKPEHKATWLVSLLTPLARHAFTGPAPAFLFDSNIRGSGKSLLADVVSLIVTGRCMARMSNPRNDDESRKRITAIAMAGDPLVLIDNIAGTLGSPSLDAALTGDVWKDRVLGKPRGT